MYCTTKVSAPQNHLHKHSLCLGKNNKHNLMFSFQHLLEINSSICINIFVCSLDFVTKNKIWLYFNQILLPCCFVFDLLSTYCLLHSFVCGLLCTNTQPNTSRTSDSQHTCNNSQSVNSTFWLPWFHHTWFLNNTGLEKSTCPHTRSGCVAAPGVEGFVEVLEYIGLQ